MIGKALLKVAKSHNIGRMVGLGFQYASFLIPVKRLVESNKVMCFYHPKPSYTDHILLVPKKQLANLLELAEEDNKEYLSQIFVIFEHIMKNKSNLKDSYVLCANGGLRQEVQQVHFHLFRCKELASRAKFLVDSGEIVYSDEYITIKDCAEHQWDVQLAVTSVGASIGSFEKINSLLFERVIKSLTKLDEKFNLSQIGFTVIFQWNQETDNNTSTSIFIAGGKKENFKQQSSL